MNRAFDWLLHHRLVSIGILLLFLFIPFRSIPTLTIDNSIEVWLLPNSQAFQQYQEFLHRYGSEEFVVIGIENAAANSSTMQSLAKAAQDIRKISTIQDVWDPQTFEQEIQNLSDWPELTEALRGMTGRHLYSRDRRHAGMIVFLQDLKGSETRRKTVESIEAALHNRLPADTTIHIAGAPYLNVTLDRTSQKTAQVFFPIIIAVSFVILYFLFRDVKAVLALMASIFYILFISIGVFALTRTPMNMVTVILPVMIFVNAASQAIHFTSRFLHLNSQADVRGTLRDTFAELFMPVLFTCLTTAAGYGSLIGAGMKPVADLGLYTALGVCIAFAANITFLPLMLSFFYTRPQPSTIAVETISLQNLGLFVCKHAAWILPLSIVITGALFWKGSEVKPQNNILNFFPPDSAIVPDYDWIGRNLSGFYTVELDLTAAHRDSTSVLNAIRTTSKRLSEMDFISGVQHAADLLPPLQFLEELGEDIPEMGSLQALANRYRYYDDSTQQDHYRISVLVNSIDSDHLEGLVHKTRQTASAHLPSSIQWQLTGIVPLLNQAQSNLLTTQIQSLFYSSASVFIMIGLLFRSLKAVWVSLIPNLLPISFTFAIMAVFGIPLDTATVMIAGIAMGIVVDDTIHLIAQYKSESQKQTDWLPSVKIAHSLSKVGRATLFTSLLIVVGFFSLYFADFRPLSYFGLLTALTMIVASLGDLLVLPAFIHKTKLWSHT